MPTWKHHARLSAAAEALYTSPQGLEELHRAHRDLCDDVAAIKLCMERAGLVSSHAFHCVRFKVVCARSGYRAGQGPLLPDLFEQSRRIRALLSSCDAAATRMLCNASLKTAGWIPWERSRGTASWEVAARRGAAAPPGEPARAETRTRAVEPLLPRRRVRLLDLLNQSVAAKQRLSRPCGFRGARSESPAASAELRCHLLTAREAEASAAPAGAPFRHAWRATPCRETLLASKAPGQSQSLAAAAEPKIYVCGGASSSTSMPLEAPGQSQCLAAADEPKIYVCGGASSPTSRPLEAPGQSQSLAPAAEPKIYFCGRASSPTSRPLEATSQALAATAEPKIYLCGGASSPTSRPLEAPGQSQSLAVAAEPKIYICGGASSPTSSPLEALATEVEPKIYVCGGASSPTSKPLQALAAAAGPKIYVCGGANAPTSRPLEACEAFALAACEWEALPAMPHPRLGCGAAVAGGRLCVCGGDRMRAGYGAEKAHCFNPARNCWEPLPNLIQWRSDAAVAAWGSWLYACGGEDDLGNEALSSVECLDVSDQSGGWQMLRSSMRASRRSFAAVAIENDLIVCGGAGSPTHQGPIGLPTRRSVEVLHLHGPSAWEWLPSMLAGRASHAAVAHGRALIVCGGAVASGRAVGSCERLDLEKEVWSSLPAMQVPRAELAAVIVGSAIFVMGGRRHNCAGEHALRSLECLSLEGGDWEILPHEMSHPRLGFCAGAADSGIGAGFLAGQLPRGDGGWRDQET